MAQYTVNVDADANVDSLNPTTNYGNNSRLYLTTDTTTPQTRYFYMKFTIPDVDIQSAILNFKLAVPPEDDGRLVLVLIMATASWNESTITWSSRPFNPAEVITSFTLVGGTNAWRTIDLTELAKSTKGAAVNLVFIPESANMNSYVFSKESSYASYLSVSTTTVLLKATARFRSSPSGASVELGDNPTGHVTPYDLISDTALYDTYSYLLSGYQREVFFVDVPLGQDITFSKTLTPSAPPQSEVIGIVTDSQTGSGF